jgi:hypothetical protein
VDSFEEEPDRLQGEQLLLEGVRNLFERPLWRKLSNHVLNEGEYDRA